MLLCSRWKLFLQVDELFDGLHTHVACDRADTGVDRVQGVKRVLLTAPLALALFSPTVVILVPDFAKVQFAPPDSGQ